MGRPYYHGHFPSLEFPKTGAEIVAKATNIRDELLRKIEERELRIESAASEANMKNAKDVLLSLQSISQGHSGAGDINMNVGLAAKVRSEVNELTKEKEEVARLNLVINNLPKEATFTLDFEELKYFGF